MPYQQLQSDTREFYVPRAIRILDDAGIEYLVGGAYALAHHANVVRHTKDFDVFVRRQDGQRTLNTFAAAGLATEMTFPHWLGKAFRPNSDDFVDVIFGSGNSLCPVDEEWFERFGQGGSLRPAGEVVPGGGDHLDQVVRPGARALRRRRTSRTSCGTRA